MLRVVALAALLSFALVATATPARAGIGKRGPAIVVYAGPPSMAKVLRVNLQADAPAFFPANVTIRAGQSIRWRIHGFHTITFPGANPNLPLVEPHRTCPSRRWPTRRGFHSGGLATHLSPRSTRCSSSNGAAQRSASRLTSATRGSCASSESRMKRRPVHTHLPRTRGRATTSVRFIWGCAERLRCFRQARSQRPRGIARQAKKQRSKAFQVKPASTRDAKGRHADPWWVPASGSEKIMYVLPERPQHQCRRHGDLRGQRPDHVHTVTFGPEEYTSAIENTVFEYAGARLVFNPLSALASEPRTHPRRCDTTGRTMGTATSTPGSSTHLRSRTSCTSSPSPLRRPGRTASSA